MSRAISKERKKELLDTYVKRQRISKWSDTLAIAAFLYLLVCIIFNKVDFLCCAIAGGLVLVSLALFFLFNRCPNCNALMWNRKNPACKKCGLEIKPLSKPDYTGRKKKKKK